MPSGIDDPMLIVDIGMGFGSGLMIALGDDPRLVLLGIEGHPDNFQRSYYNMFEGKNVRMIRNYESVRDRTVIKSTLVSNKEGMIPFYENLSPQFGSILESLSGVSLFAQTNATIKLPSTKLRTLLAQVPTEYTYHYLNINAQDAGMQVIKGGLPDIAKFNMVSVDCPRTDNRRRMEWTAGVGGGGHKGGCERDALDFKMIQVLGFDFHYCGLTHCHYARSQAHLSAITHLFRLREWRVVEKLKPNYPSSVRTGFVPMIM